MRNPVRKPAGQPCPKCGLRSPVRHTGHDRDNRVVRQRICSCGRKFTTIELTIPQSYFKVVDRPPRGAQRIPRLWTYNISASIKATQGLVR